MALKSTICRAELQISDIDRGYYHTHNLTVAKHPSETDERMMLRLLAFTLYASPDLKFGKGVSTADEPDLWMVHDNGEIGLWIDLGQPDEKRIRRACGMASKVVILSYGGAAAEQWWLKNAARLQRFKNLEVFNVPVELSRQLSEFAHRNMALQCMIQDGIWFGDESGSSEIKLDRWKELA